MNLITYLEHLKEQRGGPRAFAALRRGLGKRPGTEPDTHRYVIPYFPEKRSRWDEDAHFLIASLFALHPMSAREGNMGNHFAALCEPEAKEPPTNVERRFNALLASHPDDLYRTLQQAVSLLKSKDVPVNWHRLLADLQCWDDMDERREIQRRWAKGFWETFARRARSTSGPAPEATSQ